MTRDQTGSPRERIAKLPGGAVLYRTGPRSYELRHTPWLEVIGIGVVGVMASVAILIWVEERWLVLLPVGLAVFGAAIATSSRLVLDGAAGKLSLHLRSLLKRKTETWPLPRIGGAAVVTKHGDRRTFYMPTLNLVNPITVVELDIGLKYSDESEAIIRTIEAWRDECRVIALQ